jgi:signal transduction histidine kinase
VVALSELGRRATLWWYAGWILAASADVAGYLAMQVSNDFSPYWAVSRILTAVCLEVVGLVLWRRRPENPVGPLLLAVALIAMASHAANVPNPLAMVLGWLAQPLPPIVVAHALLLFPDGRYHHRGERFFVRTAYAVTLLLQLVNLLVSKSEWLAACEPRCNPNPLLIRANSPFAYTVTDTWAIANLVLALAFVWLLGRRIMRAGPAVKRAYRPTLAAIGLLVANFVFRELTFAIVGSVHVVFGVAEYAQLAGSVALPVCMAYGLLRARPNVADLVTRLERSPPDRVGAELAAFLGDPTLQVVLRRTGGDAVDLNGAPVYVDARGRAVTVVDAETSLLHDPALLDDPALLHSVTAAARLTLERARLQAEVRAQLREAQESRARLARAALDERRRIERDLHDGAQQRLIAVGMSIEHARRHIDASSAAATALDEAATEVVNTLTELRELARGLRPALLVERGLAGAIPVLIRRTPLPVRLTLDVASRLTDTVEATAYFVVSEALQNVVKHANADRAEVLVVLRHGRLRVEVGDDGLGGANPDGGSGLRGLADRVAAIAGEFSVASPVGHGTVVTAEIPLPDAPGPHVA